MVLNSTGIIAFFYAYSLYFETQEGFHYMVTRLLLVRALNFKRLLSLFNLHAEYIMRNTGLEKTQAVIKIAGRNINNLRYADDTTLMAESEEELNSLLMKVKRRVKELA